MKLFFIYTPFIVVFGILGAIIDHYTDQGRIFSNIGIFVGSLIASIVYEKTEKKE